MSEFVYLDYHATTPVDERILEVMLPYFTKIYGNPSGAHVASWQANEACDQARNALASLLKAKPEEIYFTASATEANNWILKSTAQLYGSGKRNRILISSIEHPSVAKVCEDLSTGIVSEKIKVDPNGLIDLEDLEEKLKKEDVLLVSILHGNNEIGSLQDLEKISRMVKNYGCLLHSDAVQTFAKYPIDLSQIPIDFLSWSSHKFYGPKGVGGLFIKEGIKMAPFIIGGSHERGLRAGTLNVPGIVGMAEAATLTYQLREKEAFEVAEITKTLKLGLEGLLEKHDIDYIWNNDSEQKLYNNLSLSLGNRDLSQIKPKLRRICYSTGSACSSKSGADSPVLKAIGLKAPYLKNTLRLSTGRMTTKEEIQWALEIFEEALKN